MMHTGKLHLLLLPLLVALFSATSSAEAMRCEDQRGNTIFTDNRSLCFGDNKTALVLKTSTELKPQGKLKTNYRIPQRQYQVAHSDWTIYLEKSLTEGDKELAAKALKKLEKNLKEIFKILPTRSAAELKNLKFYLMWGKHSPSSGRVSGMAYFRQGEPEGYAYLDPRWQHAIVVYSAKNLMYLDALWTKKALMHELAHAWHITNWSDKYKPIYSAYLNAKSKGLYRNVKDYKGKIIPQAYAIKNQLEYFAELSAIYFVGGNYMPFNRSKLYEYDRVGNKVICDLWSSI
jgi:hypothetical protein